MPFIYAMSLGLSINEFKVREIAIEWGDNICHLKLVRWILRTYIDTNSSAGITYISKLINIDFNIDKKW